MAMGECSAWAAYRRTQSQVCSLAYELAATWRWPTFLQVNHSELSHMAGVVDDSSINVVVVIINIIIIIITNLPIFVRKFNCSSPTGSSSFVSLQFHNIDRRRHSNTTNSMVYKAPHFYSATNCKRQLQRRFASQTEWACSLWAVG